MPTPDFPYGFPCGFPYGFRTDCRFTDFLADFRTDSVRIAVLRISVGSGEMADFWEMSIHTGRMDEHFPAQTKTAKHSKSKEILQ